MAVKVQVDRPKWRCSTEPLHCTPALTDQVKGFLPFESFGRRHLLAGKMSRIEFKDCRHDLRKFQSPKQGWDSVDKVIVLRSKVC